MKRHLMIQLAMGSLLCLLCITGVQAQDRMDRMQAMARELSGTFLEAQSMGWATVLFVVRQEGNKFPHIWAGRWSGSDLVLRAEYDPLDDDVLLRATGGLNLMVTHPANRIGLDKLFPLQALVADIRDQPVTIRLQGFQSWEIVPEEDVDRRRRRIQGHHSRARATAVIHWGDREFSFPGQVLQFVHRSDNNSLLITGTLTVQGEPMGMPENQHGDITIEINVTSPPAGVPPEQEQGSSDLLGF